MIWLSGSVGQPTNREAGLSLQKDPMGFATPTAHGTAGLQPSMPRATGVRSVYRRKKPLSEAEFLRLPDDGRKYELVDGEAKEVPTGFEHGVLAIRRAAQLLVHVHPWGYVCDSSTGFRMANGRIRSPDVSVVARTRIPTEIPKGFFEGAPDLAIEIVSPFEDMPDLLSKVGEYFASGAKQVWLLFPETRQAVIYHSPFDMVRLQAGDELSGGTLLPDFRVKVAELFEMG